MRTNNVQYKNWNDLDDIDDVIGHTAEDQACLKEIQGVLERHGKTRLFGVALLHRHFDLAEDEVMMEAYDATVRTLTSRPMRLAELDAKTHRPTLWRLDDGEIRPVAGCPGSYGLMNHWGYKDND